MAKFCGQRSPPLTIQSLGRYFKLIFESNELFENTGFQAVYSFIDTKSTVLARSINQFTFLRFQLAFRAYQIAHYVHV